MVKCTANCQNVGLKEAVQRQNKQKKAKLKYDSTYST